MAARLRLRPPRPGPQGRRALRAGRQARPRQCRRAEQRRGVRVPQGRQEEGRGVLPARREEPAVPDARGRRTRTRGAARGPTDVPKDAEKYFAAVARRPPGPARRAARARRPAARDGQQHAGAGLPAALHRRRAGVGRLAAGSGTASRRRSATGASAEEYARRLRTEFAMSPQAGLLRRRGATTP